MDPLTAALNLANTVAQIILLAIQSQSPETRAAFSAAQMEHLARWQSFVDRFHPAS